MMIMMMLMMLIMLMLLIMLADHASCFGYRSDCALLTAAIWLSYTWHFQQDFPGVNKKSVSGAADADDDHADDSGDDDGDSHDDNSDDDDDK